MALNAALKNDKNFPKNCLEKCIIKSRQEC